MKFDVVTAKKSLKHGLSGEQKKICQELRLCKKRKLQNNVGMQHNHINKIFYMLLKYGFLIYGVS